MAIGKKTGGRQKGTPNKLKTEIKAEVAKIVGVVNDGLLPLDVMLEAMRELWELAGDNPLAKVAACKIAKDAAPYCHAALRAVEVTGKDGGAIETIKRVERVLVGQNITDQDREGIRPAPTIQ